MTNAPSRRSGGRAARKALRAAPIAKDERPVQPGMSGGTYRPLSDADIMRIHRAALDALAEIGLADAPPSGVEAMTAAGAVLGDDGRLRFSHALIEDLISRSKNSLTLFGRDPAHDLELTGRRVHYGTAGAAVHMVDAHGRIYRESTAQDIFDAARIADRLDNIHFVQRPMVARDISDNFEMDVNTLYACCAGTTKHVGTSISDPSFASGIFQLLHMMAGSEAKWRERPFVSASNCFVVPPMKFATESCQTMETCIREGMPVLLLSAGQAGATAPASLAGAIMQAAAECLAGLFYVDAIAPGHPVVFGTWPFVSDLRTGAMSGGSGEQALMTAGCAQMHQFYGLPGGAPAGFADAKLPDMQAGWEQATSAVTAGLAGLNMVYEAAGMHASLLGFCHESLILSDDLIGQALRCVRGIEVSDENLSLDTMRRVCIGGPGHYLGQPQTLELLERATARKVEILSSPSQARFPAEVDAQIREAFNIHIPA